LTVERTQLLEKIGFDLTPDLGDTFYLIDDETV